MVATQARNVQRKTQKDSSTTCTKHPAGNGLFLCYSFVSFIILLFYKAFLSAQKKQTKKKKRLDESNHFCLLTEGIVSSSFSFFMAIVSSVTTVFWSVCLLCRKCGVFFFLNSWKYGCFKIDRLCCTICLWHHVIWISVSIYPYIMHYVCILRTMFRISLKTLKGQGTFFSFSFGRHRCDIPVALPMWCKTHVYIDKLNLW